MPGTGFKQFVFAETGDTDNRAGTYTSKPGSIDPNVPAASVAAWGALVKVTLPTLGASTGLSVQTVELGDQTHNSFDNVTFLDANTVLTTEDRGDGLHDQLDTLDSVWSFDLTKNLASINGSAQRLEAQGRDTEAAPSGKEDNEPTGIHVSDGATTTAGLLGAVDPGTQAGVRVFLTQQHGFNTTYELSADGANTPAGPAGANGTNGAGGAAGTNGKDGKDGAPGPAGPAGPAGPVGSSAGSQSGHVTITYAFDGPSKDRYARVRLNLPTTGKIEAKLTARRKGKVVSLGSSTQRITRKGAQTVKILVPRAYYERIKDGSLSTAKLTLTFHPSNGTKGVETATVEL